MLIVTSRMGQGVARLDPWEAAKPTNLPSVIWAPGSNPATFVTTPLEFQNALNTCNTGDRIVLPNQCGWNQQFIVPARGFTGPGRVYVMSQAVYDGTAPFMQGHTDGDDLLGFGRCVSGFEGIQLGQPDDRPYLATLAATDSAFCLAINNNASYFTFAGLDISFTGSFSYGLVGNAGFFYKPSDLFNNIQCWWCYIHGSDAQVLYGGLRANGTDLLCINCEISGIRSNIGDGTANGDIQSISSTVVQRMRVYQCRLVAAGENIMIGGGDPTWLSSTGPIIAPGMSDWQPQDFDVDRCHIYKPDRWFTPSVLVPSKNLFEFKGVLRARLHRSLVHHTPVSAQNTGLAMQNVSQNGTDQILTNTDITVENNIIHDVPNLHTWGSRVRAGYGRIPWLKAERFVFQNNLCYNLGSDPWALNGGTVYHFYTNADAANVQYRFNTLVGGPFIDGGWLNVATGGGTNSPIFLQWPQGPLGYEQNLAFTDNVVDIGQYALFFETTQNYASMSAARNGVWRRFAQYGSSAGTLNQWMGIDLLGGRLWNQNGVAVDEQATVKFTDPTNHNYRLQSSSPFKGIGLNGRDPGVNQDTITRLTRGVI